MQTFVGMTSSQAPTHAGFDKIKLGTGRNDPYFPPVD